jgi:hypothetical protein
MAFAKTLIYAELSVLHGVSIVDMAVWFSIQMSLYLYNVIRSSIAYCKNHLKHV